MSNSFLSFLPPPPPLPLPPLPLPLPLPLPSLSLCFFFFKSGILSVALYGTCSVNQAGLKLTKIHLPLPPKCWDLSCAPQLTEETYNSFQMLGLDTTL